MNQSEIFDNVKNVTKKITHASNEVGKKVGGTVAPLLNNWIEKIFNTVNDLLTKREHVFMDMVDLKEIKSWFLEKAKTEGHCKCFICDQEVAKQYLKIDDSDYCVQYIVQAILVDDVQEIKIKAVRCIEYANMQPQLSELLENNNGAIILKN